MCDVTPAGYVSLRRNHNTRLRQCKHSLPHTLSLSPSLLKLRSLALHHPSGNPAHGGLRAIEKVRGHVDCGW